MSISDPSHEGIDWETSGAGVCAGLDGSGKGLEGIQLLQQSVNITQELGIRYVNRKSERSIVDTILCSKSCTILINYRKVCIHDSTWKECEVRLVPSRLSTLLNDATIYRTGMPQVTSRGKSPPNGSDSTVRISMRSNGTALSL